MTLTDARKKIEDAGGNWEVFCKWMNGQTCGFDPATKEILPYDWDVDRFIKYKCNPANEPIEEWD